MKINEKKVLEYLEKHIGDRETTFSIMNRSGAYDENCDEKNRKDMMEIDSEIRKIAEDNGYRFNSHHHDNEFLGMPYVYGFYIEIGDVEKDIKRINEAFQLKMKLVLIEQEYGIYDAEKDLIVGFRTSMPWQIKKIYDEISDTIDELEADGTIID